MNSLPGINYLPSTWLRGIFVSIFCSSLLVIHPGCQPIVALGKNPSGEELKKMEALPNYRNGQFQNLERRTSDTSYNRIHSFRWTRFVKYIFSRSKETWPHSVVPAMISDLRTPAGETPIIIWFGHSSFLIKTRQGNVLVDPNFSGYAGPFKGSVTAFDGSNIYDVRDLPPIDVLLISHDHYDHLDYNTVKYLRKRVKRVIVPMGVGSHFMYWRYKKSMITELNWNESYRYNQQLNITATPARHRSGRTLKGNKTLWASYVIQAGDYKFYYSGDTGYGIHFRKIGQQYGPFDIAFLECGQYNNKWPQNHMFPWQTARAATDLGAKLVIPVHWAKFAESEHPWNEPVNLLQKSADSLHLPLFIPMIGQPVSPRDTLIQYRWWDFK
jgi:L-ascorbate metabolism protein UlaG (beta-lactamase superfamily)